MQPSENKSIIAASYAITLVEDDNKLMCWMYATEFDVDIKNEREVIPNYFPSQSFLRRT